MEYYKLTEEKLKWGDYTLYRIIATCDFRDVKKGDKGGWINKTSALTNFGWIYDKSKVYNNSHIDNSYITNNSRINDSRINDSCIDNSCVDDSRIANHSCVEDSRIDDSSIANALLKKEKITNTKDYITIGLLGNNHIITVTKSGNVYCGCWYGILADFKKAVDEKYNGKGDYYNAIKFIEQWLKEKKKEKK